MSVESEIEAVIERGTYLGLTAGLLAEKLLLDTDLQDFTDEFEGAILVAALVTFLHDYILEQLVGISRDVVQIIGGDILTAETIDAVVADELAHSLAIVEGRLDTAISELNRYVISLTDYGLSDSALEAALTNDATAKAMLSRVGSVLRQGAAGIVSSVEAALREAAQAQLVAQAEAQGEDAPQFVWVTVEDGRVCEGAELISCAPRHGVTRTLDEWSEIGLPKAPNLICSMFSRSGLSNCRCLLAEAGTPIARDVTNGRPALDISGAVARGRQAAEDAA